MTSIAGRNLKVFFRDKTAVFFSMLAPFIIIGLYVLFLGKTFSEAFEDIPSREFMDNWIMAGLLTVTTVTSTMGAFGVMVSDRSKNVLKDYYASPIKRSRLTAGYVLSSFLIGLILTFVTLIPAQLYILSNGGALLGFVPFLKVSGILVVSSFCNTAMVFLIVSFLSSESAYATASSVIGTLIGFVTGIYIPIKSLPEGVRWIVRLFPPSHAASLLRQVMMKKPLEAAFAGAQDGMMEETREFLGVVYTFGSYKVSPIVSLGMLLLCGTVCFLISVKIVSKQKK